MKKFILLEEEKLQIKSMYGLTEATMTPPAPVRPTTVMDTLAVTPNKLLFQNSTNNNNTIFLSIRDAAGKKNTKYNIQI